MDKSIEKVFEHYLDKRLEKYRELATVANKNEKINFFLDLKKSIIENRLMET